MNEEQFKKELSELLDTLPKPEFGIDCITIHVSESAYNEFNRLRQELWEKYRDENFEKEKQELLDKINLYEDWQEFEKQKFREQEEIRNRYYKLLDNV